MHHHFMDTDHHYAKWFEVDYLYFVWKPHIIKVTNRSHCQVVSKPALKSGCSFLPLLCKFSFVHTMYEIQWVITIQTTSPISDTLQPSEIGKKSQMLFWLLAHIFHKSRFNQHECIGIIKNERTVYNLRDCKNSSHRFKVGWLSQFISFFLEFCSATVKWKCQLKHYLFIGQNEHLHK